MIKGLSYWFVYHRENSWFTVISCTVCLKYLQWKLTILNTGQMQNNWSYRPVWYEDYPVNLFTKRKLVICRKSDCQKCWFFDSFDKKKDTYTHNILFCLKYLVINPSYVVSQVRQEDWFLAESQAAFSLDHIKRPLG